MKWLFALLGITLAGCGGKIADEAPVPQRTESFIPSRIKVQRYAERCVPANPPFRSGDHFQMDVFGDERHAPLDVLSFGVIGTVPLGRGLALTVEPFNAMGTYDLSADGGETTYADQSASEGVDTRFEYSQGADPSEIDTGPYDAVDLTVLSLPAKDGDLMSIRARVHFVDGRELDEIFAGELPQGSGNCQLVN